MKKIRIYNFFIFLMGIMFLSLGIVLVLKSNLGVSVATSIPYVLSKKFTRLTFGQWNYIIQGLVLLLLVLMVRKLTIKFLMSFLVAFLFGKTLDMFSYIMKDLVVSGILGRIGVFALGTVIISLGLSAFIKSDYPILPFDTFIKEICARKRIEISRFKTGFDVISFLIALSLSFIFFARVEGVGLGTFISAVTIGPLIGVFLRLINEKIEGSSFIEEEKFNRILDRDLLNL